jgi:diguanylate cyclase (GGDEF)-like protein
LALGLLGLFTVAFFGYVRAERAIDRSYEARLDSFTLASELRQSSDDLTRMARTYVGTGDPLFKQHYQEVLGIREGQRPRPLDAHNVYWDLVGADDRRPRPFGPAEALVERMRRVGVTPAELARLHEAKAASDALTRLEYQAMDLMDRNVPTAPGDRAKALALLYGPDYRAGKAAVMRPIGEFLDQVNTRTLAAVRTAGQRALAMRVGLMAVGLALLVMLWRLLDLIQREARELARYRDHLEQLVAQRTEQLEQRNRQLNHEMAAREEAEESIRKLAFNDLLTQLPNRRLLQDRLQEALGRARRNNGRIALLFIDLDRFKPVNDELGHETGDWLLQMVAQRMLECLREYDTAARFGGDEFVIMLPDLATSGDALGVAERIRVSLEQPFVTEDGVELHISSSIGVAFFPDHADNGRDLLHAGDDAMYLAKRGGRNRIVVFEPGGGFPEDDQLHGVAPAVRHPGAGPDGDVTEYPV